MGVFYLAIRFLPIISCALKQSWFGTDRFLLFFEYFPPLFISRVVIMICSSIKNSFFTSMPVYHEMSQTRRPRFESKKPCCRILTEDLTRKNHMVVDDLQNAKETIWYVFAPPELPGSWPNRIVLLLRVHCYFKHTSSGLFSQMVFAFVNPLEETILDRSMLRSYERIQNFHTEGAKSLKANVAK